MLEANTEIDIEKFAQDLDISLERAMFIERMREHYIAWEYGYIKEESKSKQNLVT